MLAIVYYKRKRRYLVDSQGDPSKHDCPKMPQPKHCVFIFATADVFFNMNCFGTERATHQKSWSPVHGDDGW